jgi:hypothetical protein
MPMVVGSRRWLQKNQPSQRVGGRPRDPQLEEQWEPTKEQRDLVKLLAGYDVSEWKICRLIRNPLTRRSITIETLHKHFEEEIEIGHEEMDAICLTMLTMQLRKGNMTAIIWYMKNRLGWKDVVETHRINTDVKLDLDKDELIQKLKERGLPLSVFGIDEPVLELEAKENEAKTPGNGDATRPNRRVAPR